MHSQELDLMEFEMAASNQEAQGGGDIDPFWRQVLLAEGLCQPGCLSISRRAILRPCTHIMSASHCEILSYFGARFA